MLCFSPAAFGQRKLSQEAFQVNVRPVLSGILSDFYQMISLFPDFPREVVGLAEQMDDFTADKEILRSSCPRQLDEKCLETIESMRGKISTLQDKTLAMLLRLKPSSTAHLSSLAGLRVIYEFHSQLELVKGQLDNSSFLIKGKIKSRHHTFPLIRQLDELSTLISLSLVEFIPYQYQVDFRHFYFNFVHPVQLHKSKNQNYEFLNRNINSLNFSLNLLNMNLTKRNKKTPEGMAPYLATIHNRWNSLLRYYF